MKRLALFAAIGALLLTDLSFAQPPGQSGRPPDQRPGGNGPPGNKPDRPATLPAPVPGNPGRPNPGGPGQPNRPPTNPGGPGGPGMRPPPRPTPPSVRPPPRPNRPQFSWHGRYYNPIYGPAYRYPRGYSYRRWGIGAFLPSLFLSTLYYYDDWRTLGFGPPPPGRRWVRYGPDLLLVNVHTRRVEDVIYGVFY